MNDLVATAARAAMFGSVLATIAGAGAAGAENLNIVMMAVTGEQRSALVETVDRFRAANPEIEVGFDQIEQEAYKARFDDLVAAGDYDVMFSFAGERLRGIVTEGLIRPLETLDNAEGVLQQFSEAAVSAVSVDGRAFALPLSYYNWGLFYHRPLFEQLNLTPPETWSEFKDMAATLADAGVAPIAIGSVNAWPLAGWFDYLNLRINGLDSHLALLRGETPFTAPGVRRVFEVWAELVEAGWFLDGHAAMDWREPLPYLYRNRAGVYLMGSFVVSQMPEAIRGQIGYFPFPEIDPSVPRAEDAPTDVLVVPAAAENIAEAGAFLAFMAQPENLGRLNAAIGQLPPRGDVALPDDPFVRAGAETLAAATGVAQFFDRDAVPAIRDAGLAAFQRFVADPSELDAILAELETVRLATAGD